MLDGAFPEGHPVTEPEPKEGKISMSDYDTDLEYRPYEEILKIQTAKVRELMAGPWQNAPGFVHRLTEAGLTPPHPSAA